MLTDQENLHAMLQDIHKKVTETRIDVAIIKTSLADQAKRTAALEDDVKKLNSQVDRAHGVLAVLVLVSGTVLGWLKFK
jgi:5-bromo-4-chloroindolyl phosphate hydrolysis protein